MIYRWYQPPPRSGASCAEHRHHAALERYHRHEIGVRWDELFERLWVPTVPGASAGSVRWESPPEMGTVTLGPPTRFTVRLRAGLLAADIAALAPRLASMFEVDAVTVRVLAPGWVVVVMVEHDPAEAPVVEPAPPTIATPEPRDDAAPGGDRVRGHYRPLGRRERRRPFGGPRSLR